MKGRDTVQYSVPRILTSNHLFDFQEESDFVYLGKIQIHVGEMIIVSEMICFEIT